MTTRFLQHLFESITATQKNIMNAIQTPNINTFNVLKTCKQTALRCIQVAWTGSVIYKQYKFVLKIQGFVRDKI